MSLQIDCNCICNEASDCPTHGGKPTHQQRIAELESQCAAMREALEPAYKALDATEWMPAEWYREADAALASDTGKALLERHKADHEDTMNLLSQATQKWQTAMARAENAERELRGLADIRDTLREVCEERDKAERELAAFGGVTALTVDAAGDNPAITLDVRELAAAHNRDVRSQAFAECAEIAREVGAAQPLLAERTAQAIEARARGET